MFRSCPGISYIADAHRGDLYSAAARDHLRRAARHQHPSAAAVAARRLTSGLERIVSLIQSGQHAAGRIMVKPGP